MLSSPRARYVAERVPRLQPVVRAVLPSEMEKNFGALSNSTRIVSPIC